MEIKSDRIEVASGVRDPKTDQVQSGQDQAGVDAPDSAPQRRFARRASHSCVCHSILLSYHAGDGPRLPVDAQGAPAEASAYVTRLPLDTLW